jgi:hypothetical protein
MQVSPEELSKQLIEYRKATRALMFYYDAAEALFNLIENELDSLNLFRGKVDNLDRFQDTEENDWEFPKGVTFAAFKDVTGGINSWDISCCSEDDAKPRKNSVLLYIKLDMDYFPYNDPKDSISVLVIYAYKINHVKGRLGKSDTIDGLEDNFKPFSENDNVDEYGEPKSLMKLKLFPNSWVPTDKYKGDFAAGLYDLSELSDEDAVRNIVIKDIKDLLEKWEV